VETRCIEGAIKTLTVKRDSRWDIYLYLACETEESPVEPRSGESVGFDFGLKTSLKASDGVDAISPLTFPEFAPKRSYLSN
jgi:putative transposase